MWTTRDQIDQTDYALDVASKIITYFEKYYKVDYPLPKQGKNIEISTKLPSCCYSGIVGAYINNLSSYVLQPSL